MNTKPPSPIQISSDRLSEDIPLKIRFKKLSRHAIAPTRAHDTDAGFELTAVSREYDSVTNTTRYHTGIAVEIPPGYFGAIFQRSSIYKTSLLLANCVGAIDSGYRGEILLHFRTVPGAGRFYQNGDRIGRLVILPLPQVEFEEGELSESERRTAGFGSAGE